VWRRAALLLAGLLLAVGLGGVAAWRVVRDRYDRPGPLAEPAAVVVPRGTPAQVAGALARAGVIADPFAFRLAVAATAREGPLHAAELLFPAHASLGAVLATLRTARPVEHRLTIPEGLTAAQIAELLARAPALAGDEAVPDEGAVLPQTYDYELGTARGALLGRAEAAMTRTLTEIWAGRDPDLPLAGPADLLVLASMIEHETARPEERPLVAAVFLNRLRKGMKLQSDPTVAYGVSGGSGMLERPLARADLGWPNPYNTYLVSGLPPGPICSPGLASLQAAAHPAHADFLYFVADGTGGHAFARTLEEHARNVARWRAQTAPVR
jgi:UPF0755 protein